MEKRESECKVACEALLFICLGNICRSPAAEGVLKTMLEARGMSAQVRVDSAGIGSWHVGELPDARMRRHAQQRGYVLDSRARQFTEADFNRFDYIVVMDDENEREFSRAHLPKRSVDRCCVCVTSLWKTRGAQAFPTRITGTAVPSNWRWT